mgnify:CR=1 FL=1
MSIAITIEDMKNGDTITYPSLKEVREAIQGIIDNISKNIIVKSRNEKYAMSESMLITFRGSDEKKFSNSDFSISITYSLFDIQGKSQVQLKERSIYIFVFQDARSGEFSITVTNSIKQRLKILFSCINSNPIPQLEKYLSNILSTSITILKAEYGM